MAITHTVYLINLNLLQMRFISFEVVVVTDALSLGYPHLKI
jgi:hypothetical protein